MASESTASAGTPVERIDLQRPRLARRVLRLAAVNLLVFLVYRSLFVFGFATSSASGDVAGVLWGGLRLDVAVVTQEICAVWLVLVAIGRLRPASIVAGLWLVTGVNLGIAAVNLVFYGERRQHVWEMLLANMDEVSQIGVAVEPFFASHPWAPVPVLVVAAAVSWTAVRDVRAAGVGGPPWSRRAGFLGLLAVLVLCLVASVEAVPTKRTESGIKYRFAASKHYMQFPDHALNQAVLNPVSDLVVYHLPSALTKASYRLTQEEALALTRELLGIGGIDPRFPLLRRLPGDRSLDLVNVVLIEVEGLGTSILDRQERDGPLMPFLASLGERGLYFRNVYQSFSATDGSVFAATTSLHRGFDAQAVKSHFFPYEYEGHFGSLPHVLGHDAYRHYFFAGFRQRIDEFVSFASNQGYRAFGYDEIMTAVGDRGDAAANALGVFDDVLLDHVADVVLAAEGPFSIQVMTTTSHSPWTTPQWFAPGDLRPELATFRYADESLRRFFERLRRELPDFDRTLFVFTGDHTSITFDKDVGERLRVPLVLYSPALAAERRRWLDRQSARASHVDILPTILGRLPGQHRFAGMGRDLLSEDVGETGIVSSSHRESLYLKGRFALWYTPHDGAAQLSLVDGEEFVAGDVAADHPEVVEALKREYLALYETADRLARAGRVFPQEHQVAVIADR